MSIQAADVRTHTGRVLNDEAQLLLQLETLLQKETAIVRGDDADAIAAIGASRHDCIAALTRLEAERSASCRMLSFGEGGAAFDKLLTWCDQDGELRRRWRANLDLARRCKQLNERNGILVNAQLNHVQQLLTAMRGGAKAPVYSAQASRVVGFSSRELGCA